MTDSKVITKHKKDAMKKRADELGRKFNTKNSKGLKNIKTEDIILNDVFETIQSITKEGKHE